jgi:hypothetical protein
MKATLLLTAATIVSATLAFAASAPDFIKNADRGVAIIDNVLLPSIDKCFNIVSYKEKADETRKLLNDFSTSAKQYRAAVANNDSVGISAAKKGLAKITTLLNGGGLETLACGGSTRSCMEEGFRATPKYPNCVAVADPSDAKKTITPLAAAKELTGQNIPGMEKAIQ